MKITLLSKTLTSSSSDTLESSAIEGGKVSYARFEDACLYGEPKENGKDITRKFNVLGYRRGRSI